MVFKASCLETHLRPTQHHIMPACGVLSIWAGIGVSCYAFLCIDFYFFFFFKLFFMVMWKGSQPRWNCCSAEGGESWLGSWGGAAVPVKVLFYRNCTFLKKWLQGTVPSCVLSLCGLEPGFLSVCCWQSRPPPADVGTSSCFVPVAHQGPGPMSISAWHRALRGVHLGVSRTLRPLGLPPSIKEAQWDEMTCWDHQMGRVVSDTSHQRPRPQAMQTHGSWLPRAPKTSPQPWPTCMHQCQLLWLCASFQWEGCKAREKWFSPQRDLQEGTGAEDGCCSPGAKGCPHGRAGETYQPSFPWSSWKQQNSFISLGTDLADKAAP